jgi:formylglycine-generating enzyme required for sulfatase activity
MPRIFISYRRADTAIEAGRIYEHLVRVFGRDNMFKDVDDIPIGMDFRVVLRDAIEKCDVMLVLIGSCWLEVDSKTGLRRIDDINDFVRFEVEYALSQPHVTVIPVIISGTKPPIIEELPEPLQRLAYIDMAAVRNDPDDFHTDITRLTRRLKKLPSRFAAPYPLNKRSCATQFLRISILSSALLIVCAVLLSFIFVQPEQWGDIVNRRKLPLPSATPVPTEIIPTPSALELAVQGVTQNSEWAEYSPYMREFDDVPMVLVPSGCFTMGSTDSQIDYAMSFGLARGLFADEQGIFGEVFLICIDEPYWIDQYEVSNSQYERVSSRPARGVWHELDYPREAINWFDAAAFCAMRGARLPTEAEWEYAARGPDNLIYPWGNEYESNRLNDVYSIYYEAIVAPVTEFESGQSWVGAFNMAGNVWEWVSTAYESDDGSIVYRYPYNATDGRENAADSTAPRVIRGGSFSNNEDDSRSANRLAPKPDEAYSIFGVRCAKDFEG